MSRGKSKQSDERTAELADFQWALRALAQPADVQQELFPEAAGIGQALVETYQQAYKAYSATGYGHLTPVQRGRLRTLKATLAELSEEHNQDFWMDPQALACDERWALVRTQAETALDAFGWSADRPATKG